MKKLILLALLLVTASFAIAQNRKIIGGGGGHFMSGVTFIFPDNITDYLQEPNVIGSTYDPSPLAIQAGGEGYGIVGPFTIGGGGFGYNSFKATGSNGKVEANGGGGYFKMGYLFYNKNTSFATANVGIGGFGYTLKIRNTSTEKNIEFNTQEPILPGEEQSYEYGGAMFDLGLSFKSVFSSDKAQKEVGGFIGGLDAGIVLNFPTGEWKDGDDLLGPPNPDMTVLPYIRFTIGGGRVKFE
jgi:hypothetical protein